MTENGEGLSEIEPDHIVQTGRSGVEDNDEFLNPQFKERLKQLEESARRAYKDDREGIQNLVKEGRVYKEAFSNPTSWALTHHHLDKRCKEQNNLLEGQALLKKGVLPQAVEVRVAQGDLAPLAKASKMLEFLKEQRRNHPVHSWTSEMNWQRQAYNQGFQFALDKIEGLLAEFAGHKMDQNNGHDKPVFQLPVH